jgi:hypothetical protein
MNAMIAAILLSALAAGDATAAKPAAKPATKAVQASLPEAKQVTAPDRLILGFTGNTLPKGAFEFTAYDIFFWEFGYGVTDRIQIGAQLSPQMLTTFIMYSLSFRYQLVMTEHIGLTSFTQYAGMASVKSDLVYFSAITQGLAFTYSVHRVSFNLPLSVTATNAGMLPECIPNLDANCSYNLGWTALLLATPGISVLVAEPTESQRISINVEFIGAYAPNRSDGWLLGAGVSLRWSDGMYLGEIGLEAPIISGYGKPTADALRFVGWVVPLFNFSIQW